MLPIYTYVIIYGVSIFIGLFTYSKYAHKTELKVFLFQANLIGSMQKDSLCDCDGGSDVEDIAGMNNGTIGQPSSAKHPQ